jgi:hypothetical protein
VLRRSSGSRPERARRGTCYCYLRMRCFFLALALVCSSGCAATLETPGDATIDVRGRVVDAESCASTAGCRGVAGMIVSLSAAPDRVRSLPTALDGTFELEGVPIGYHHDLLVAPDESSTEPIAPTLNPMAVHRDADADVFGLTLYVLPRDPESLLEGIRAEGIDLLRGGGYVGQAVRVEAAGVTAAEGVSVSVAPAPVSVRYVRRFPRFVAEASTVLLEPTATVTGPFGTFVVEPDGAVDPAAFLAQQAGFEFELVVAPMQPGIVTYAVHRGSPL